MNTPWLAQLNWRWLSVVAALAVIVVMLVNEQQGALFAQASIAQASGVVYYVAPNGDDSNPGSEAQPFRTIQQGVDQAQAGDTVYVRGGTYHEAIKVNNAGAENQPLVIMAYPGEYPVINGEYTLPENTPVGCNNNVSPPRCFVWEPLVQIKANYIRFSGFEIKQSQGRGIVVSRNATSAIHHIDIENCLIHDVRHGPISIQNASYVSVQNCVVYHGADYVANNQDAANFNRPNSVTAINSDHITVRNNVVYENWGVGIGANTDSDYFTIENNVVYDNYGVQIYVHRAQHVIVRNNLVYNTNNPEFRRGSDPSSCIVLNNETPFADSQTVADVQIVGNIVTGCQRNFTIWSGDGNNLPLDDVLVTRNTFVEAVANSPRNAANVFIGDANLHNLRLEKNIILQSTRLEQAIGSAPVNPQITYTDNLWSRRPSPWDHMVSPSDVIADPQLRDPFTNLIPGAVQVQWFCPLPSSPALAGNLGAYELCNAPPALASTGSTTLTTSSLSTNTATLTAPLSPPTATIPTATPDPACLPQAANTVTNPSFEAGIADWFFSTNGQGSYTATSPGLHCATAAQIQIHSPGSTMQFYQKGVALEPNTRYQLRFAASSNTGHDLAVSIHKNAGRHTDYGLRNARADLIDRWRVYTIEFTTTGFSQPVSDARLRFWFAPYAMAGDAYGIDQVELAKLDSTQAFTNTDLGVDVVSLTLEPEENPPPSQGVVRGAIQLRGDDQALSPAVEAQVILADAATGGETYQNIMETDGEGSFYFESMPAGNYVLTVVPPPGYSAPPPATLTITGAEQLEFPYVLEQLTGMVYLPAVVL